MQNLQAVLLATPGYCGSSLAAQPLALLDAGITSVSLPMAQAGIDLASSSL